ncbi:MAG: methyltransferase domain-containing protein [Planctomycetes bacterium]|nr:methyltransferase domain-containing protein [Planctomycetota bacterium]
MCHRSCLDFVAITLYRKDIEGKKILEVGSLDVNGSVRPYVESFRPQEYIGIDITMGPGVDEICGVDDIIGRYGRERFDVIIATEVLEHVQDWRKAINNLKDVVMPGG